jgi:hypothetical protein
MDPESLQFPKEIKELKARADGLRERANELDQQYQEAVENFVKKVLRETNDKQLNRTQCLEYLSIGTLESLKNWEEKYSPYGYLRFQDNKIMRSELLEFIDDLNSGKIHRRMNRH